jgi:hypothetical protein
MYYNVNHLMNGGSGGSGESGSSSSVDYGGRIEALESVAT